MMRIVLFLATNFAVMMMVGIILSLFGIQSQDMAGLAIMAGMFGFTGSFISLFMSKTMALKSVNGQVITTPSNPMETWLVDTIRELARKDELPMPEVAIYYAHEMNAFATGRSKNHSLVAVSSGLLEGMTREEAEAVLAHEMSHIKNGDMVTMTLLQGVLNTFVIFIARLVAQAIATNRSDDEEGGSMNTGTYMMVSMALESVLGFLASIIAMWFSRQREFRADAGAARLVGKEKMIHALERLASIHHPQEMQGELAAFAINGKRGFGLKELFLTHPPIEKRIEALRNL